jgi:hypothetical protein
MTYTQVTDGILEYVYRRLRNGKTLSGEDLEDIPKMCLEVLTMRNEDAKPVFCAAYVFASTVKGVYNIPEDCSGNAVTCIAHYLIEVRVDRGEVLKEVAEKIWQDRPKCRTACQVNGVGCERTTREQKETVVHADACDDTAVVRATGCIG